MSVLLANAVLGVRKQQRSGGRTAHGERIAGTWAAVGPMLPGRTREQADGTWGLGVDPGLHPVAQGDLIVDADGREWLVDTAVLLTNNEDDSVNWIRVTARQRVADGTEPGGPQFAGR